MMKNKDLALWIALGALAYVLSKQQKPKLPEGVSKPLLSDRRVGPVEKSIGYYKSPSFRMNI